jgi:16S rRNA (cytidine1402-2'-O)-methyltransferase
MQSYHIFNEHQTVAELVERLKGGTTIAVITDAGTPGISDPGFLLVREAVKEGVEVECLPGATAFVPALIDSGLPCDRFVFLGFLPHKKGRQTALRALADESRTMIIYESPFRLVKLLEELAEVVGMERQVSVSREISKVHAETARGTVAEVLTHFKQKEVKGEIVVVLGGK